MATPAPPTDWTAALLRAQVLLSAGRTAAYAADVCGARRSSSSAASWPLECRSRRTNAEAAASLPLGDAMVVTFPDGFFFLDEDEDYDQPPPLLAILAAMESARSSVDVGFGELTCERTMHAILWLHARSEVDLRVITNTQFAQREGSRLPQLLAAGVPIRSRNTPHAAYCIVDGRVLIQGSSDRTQASVHDRVNNVRIQQNPSSVLRMTTQFAWSDVELTGKETAENCCRCR